METEYFKKMMEDYNNIKFFSENEYQSVLRRIVFRKYPKNYILKNKNEPDNFSRYICNGYIGLFDGTINRNKLKLIFGPTDTVFDKKGFRESKPTPIIIKTLSETMLFEFSKASEMALFEMNKDFCLLALEVSHRITLRTFEQSELKRLGLKNGVSSLAKKYPGIEKILKNQDLADYFNTSLRTIERHKAKIFQSKSQIL
jgi:hypothetical protein